ncbi:MAG TPA: glycosyltransferase family 4 protein [Chthoniobacteraceae bacterium]|jgi:glycosyltransferase involved in cell wall biosynthesis|nr:glycosyltransferase family 4 protein [Chthoniobacteraceae bacterium]
MDWRAIAFDREATDLPANRVRSLALNPVRAISWIVGSEYYYGAKKHALDKTAAVELAVREVEIFHGWSGESVRSLRECRRRGIPSLIEIPTWHRHKGKDKPTRLTKSERERAAAKGWQKFKNGMLVTRQQMLEEYELADRILVLSQKAEETFLAAGVPKEKLFRHQRGVDVVRFSPAPQPPEKFVAVFVGALIKRKGVHHLIDVWRKLALKDAELVLAGTVHEEIRPLLQDASSSIRILGFSARIEDVYRGGAVHIFPSECEGSAKCTYEAAACGLPQITTRESGDVVQREENGLIIPPNDPDALGAAILRLYNDRDLCARLGAAGRARAVGKFTWDHFRTRLLEAYRSLLAR